MMEHIVCADLVCGCEYTQYMSVSVSVPVFVFVSVCVCGMWRIKRTYYLHTNTYFVKLSFALLFALSLHLCVSVCVCSQHCQSLNDIANVKRYSNVQFTGNIYASVSHETSFELYDKHVYKPGLIFLYSEMLFLIPTHPDPSLSIKTISIGLCFLIIFARIHPPSISTPLWLHSIWCVIISHSHWSLILTIFVDCMNNFSLQTPAIPHTFFNLSLSLCLFSFASPSSSSPAFAFSLSLHVPISYLLESYNKNSHSGDNTIKQETWLRYKRIRICQQLVTYSDNVVHILPFPCGNVRLHERAVDAKNSWVFFWQKPNHLGQYWIRVHTFHKN